MNQSRQPDLFEPEPKDDTLYHVGVSGGKDSAAVLLWMVHESGIPKDKIEATFCDTANEHDWTLEHIALLSETVHPIKTLTPAMGFYDLAMSRHRFPSTKARFCTQALKIYPSQDHITLRFKEYKRVVNVTGSRANESTDRSRLDEWDYNANLLCDQWRPIIRWTIDDVFAIHKKYDIPLNPLYEAGAMRVGCFPCIMSRKSEIRNIALKFPERIDMIRNAEQKFFERYGRFSSFFSPNKVPERFRSMPYINAKGDTIMIPTIDDVVRWSMTGDRAVGSFNEEESDEPISCSSGFCE
jgi:3'-phosphoadenosine 5'-phosphosulfate sulfotransferase (PAPS reductase)/FAD synthetase